MGELSTLLGLLRGQATEVTAIVTLFFVAATVYLNSRKVNAEVMTTVSKAQTESLQSLMQQNRELAADLHALREQQKELHEDMDKLRAQNARMYQHILAVEQYILAYTSRCETCPHGATVVAARPKIPFEMELL